MKKLHILLLEIKNIIKLILPSSRKEYFLLIFFILMYYSIGSYLSLKTDIIDKGVVDLYFGSDHGLNLYEGTFAYLTHPLQSIFIIL